MSAPKPYTQQQVLNNLEQFVHELSHYNADAIRGPGYVLRCCQDILKRGLEPAAPIPIVQRLLDCPDVNEEMLSPETIAACDAARAAIAQVAGPAYVLQQCEKALQGHTS